MNSDEAMKMIIAKKACMENEASGDFNLCNRQCDTCRLNYEQGNLGEQIEWLGLAIDALKFQQEHDDKALPHLEITEDSKCR